MVGLLQVNVEPWKSIYEKGQLPTWIKSSPSNIEIVNIYGATPNKMVRALDRTHEKLRLSKLLQGPIHALDRYLNKYLRKKTNPTWSKKSDEYVTSYADHLNYSESHTSHTTPNPVIPFALAAPVSNLPSQR